MRQRDAFSFSDIMIDDLSALAEGESIQKATKLLSEVLSRFIFAAKITWNANTDETRVNNAITLLHRSKPADVGVIPFTQVEDGSLKDVLKGEVVSEQVSFKKIPTFSVSDLSYVGNDYIGPSYSTRTDFSALVDENWWEEVPQLNFSTDATYGKYISSLILGPSTWVCEPCPIWRAVIWDNVNDSFAIINSSAITWTTTTSTANGITTTTLAGSTVYQSRTFNIELYTEESSVDIKFWHKMWGPTGETRYSIVCGEFPRLRIQPQGNPSNMRFVETEHSGSIHHGPTLSSFKYSLNDGHKTNSAPPALGFNALYDVVLRRGIYFQFEDPNLLWKQVTYKGLGTCLEIFWTHYPKNNFTPGQFTTAAQYSQPYKLSIKNLPIRGQGESAYYDASVMYRDWIEATQPYFLPAKWRASSDVSPRTKLEKLFVVLGPVDSHAPSQTSNALVPAANFFPVFYELIRLEQFFQDGNIRAHIYNWHNNSFDMGGTQNSIPARGRASDGVSGYIQYEPNNAFTYAFPPSIYTYISANNISYMEMASGLRAVFSAFPDRAPRLFPYTIPGYWTSRNTGQFQTTVITLPYATGPTTIPYVFPVTWPDGTQPGGIGPETQYLFTGTTTPVNPLLPSNNYLLEKQTKVGGTRTLSGVAENSYFTLVPKYLENVYNPNPGIVHGVDFSRTPGQSLIVDHQKKIYNSLSQASLSGIFSGTSTSVIPLAPKGSYLDQYCGIGTNVDVVGSNNDCYVLIFDRKNAAAGDYGNIGTYHAGKRTIASNLLTTLRASDSDFAFSSEAVEEALLGKIDMMHVIGDFDGGRACFLWNMVYSQYQRTAHLGITIDPAKPEVSVFNAMWVTNDSYHKGLPLSLNYSFSSGLTDTAYNQPPYPMRHMVDNGTAALDSSSVPIRTDASGKFLIQTGVTPNIAPWGYVLGWFKQLHSSMSWIDDYRLGEPLRPLPGGVEMRRLAANTSDMAFYVTTQATQMQSIWLNPITGNIGIIITEAYPNNASTFGVSIDSIGWPLWTGIKYVYRFDGVTRIPIGQFRGNTVKFTAQLTGPAIYLYEISRTPL
jgi:hypothetical protein